MSVGGRGRCLDDAFVGRLWRGVKYECVYPSGPESVRELERGPGGHSGFHNGVRIHQSLEYQAPSQVHRAESRRPLEK